MLVSAKPGTIHTIAGTGEPGYFGDGTQATAARLNEPKSVAVDGRGHVYIADSENHVIRKVNLATGIITTVAGRREGPTSTADDRRSLSPAHPSAADDDPLGTPDRSDPERFAQLADLSGTVRFVTGVAFGKGRFAGDGGPATEALLNFPSAVAVDEQGNLYIADTMNHRIRRVDGTTGMITTVAGTGQPRFSGDGGPAVAAALNEPSAVVVDRKGRLYIADQSNNRVRVVDLETGIIRTIAGTGTATYNGDGERGIHACLAGPSGLALGPEEELYVADTFNGRIRKIDPVTGLIGTVLGDGGQYRYQGETDAPSMSLSRPYGIAADRQGNILVTDSDSHLIRRWDRGRRIVTRIAGTGVARFSGDGGPAEEASLNYPFGVAVDGNGTIFVADTFNHRIRVVVTKQP